MKLTDLIDLAKAGYTPADVREFLANDKKPDVEKTEPGKGSTEDATGEKAETENKENVSRETLKEKSDPKKPTETPDAVDYKAQYEAAMEALKKAQAANTKQQQPEPENDNKILMDAVAQFM